MRSLTDCRGYNIGIRLIDEFLAKSNVSRCIDFKETAEVIAKVSLPPPSCIIFNVCWFIMKFQFYFGIVILNSDIPHMPVANTNPSCSKVSEGILWKCKF